MKRKIKSYFAFTSLPYRILVLLPIPVLILSICLGLPFQRGSGNFYYRILLFGYLTIYEIATDYWMLAGCLSRRDRSREKCNTCRFGEALCLLYDFCRGYRRTDRGGGGSGGRAGHVLCDCGSAERQQTFGRFSDIDAYRRIIPAGSGGCQHMQLYVILALGGWRRDSHNLVIIVLWCGGIDP